MIFELRLYITGTSLQSQRAIDNLRRMSEQVFPEHQIEIIDVLEHPNLAEEDKILATPTLVRRMPKPVRKIIGDLSDQQKVLLALDLAPQKSAGSAPAVGDSA